MAHVDNEPLRTRTGTHRERLGRVFNAFMGKYSSLWILRFVPVIILSKELKWKQ